MSMPVIDAHTHLGDIMHVGGGRLIPQTGVKKKWMYDPISLSAALGYRNFGLGNLHYRLNLPHIIRAEEARNATGTLENMLNSMENLGITHSVCMPIYPYLTFEDLQPVAKKESGVVPFTGVDMESLEGIEDALAADKARGAKGIKLHPIIQKVPLHDDRTHAVAEAAGKVGLPVLFHCGISHYYQGDQKHLNIPEYGAVDHAEKLVREHPEVGFVVGHAGMFEMDQVIQLLARYDNVHVDTSLQSAGNIRKLLKAFGSDRVLFASDWPFGEARASLSCARAACKGDSQTLERVLYKNAARLYQITVD